MAGRVLLPLPSSQSDGDSKFWPQITAYVHQPADRIYHEKLADLWMEHTNQAVLGTKYAFNSLPLGYRVFTKARKSGLVDRYIFGHDKARFDSPNKFFEHFKYMMRASAGSCACINCSSSIPSGAGARTNNPISRSPPLQVNGEDSFDVQFHDFIKLCQSNQELVNFKAWNGRYSSDLLADGKTFEDIARNYRTSSSFLPRRGELVIFYSNDQPDGRFEAVTQHFKLYSDSSGQFVGFPHWRAGVVVQESEDMLCVDDLKPGTDNPQMASHCTYRIELFPDPDGIDKTLSSQTYYVTLNHIRPLSMFHEILSGLPQNKWHLTIHNALKVMCTLSVVDPIQFHGQWPSATIDCRGVWIGPELLVLGDAVRILPPAGNDGSPIDEVLVVEGIEWRFDNLDAAGWCSSVFIRGKIYTTDKNKALRPMITSFNGMQDSPGVPLPSSFAGYPWYLRSEASHDGQKGATDLDEFLLPISSIIGRLYESEAMRHLLNVVDFDVSDSGIKQARSWAMYRRQPLETSLSKGWKLATDRIEMLSIEKVNGFAVGRGRDREKLLSKNSHLFAFEAKGPTDEAGSESSATEKARIPGSNYYAHEFQVSADKRQSQRRKSITVARTRPPSRLENEDNNICVSTMPVLAGHNISDAEERDTGDDLGAKDENTVTSIKDLRASKRPRR